MGWNDTFSKAQSETLRQIHNDDKSNRAGDTDGHALGVEFDRGQ